MPIREVRVPSRRDSLRIAQRFNAGLSGTEGSVPKGRLNSGPERFHPAAPSGRIGLTMGPPALKRRAMCDDENDETNW